MYSKEECAFVQPQYDQYPVTPASFGLIQNVHLLERADVTLVAAPGELPQIAVGEEIK